MIAYMKESHSVEPKSHEWIETGETHYRSGCNRWTVPRENLIPAEELNCLWCLSRRGRRQMSTPEPDAELGIAWWNALTEPERAEWLRRADTAVPAEAWEEFKRGADQPTAEQS